jgi:hypothetical protein
MGIGPGIRMADGKFILYVYTVFAAGAKHEAQSPSHASGTAARSATLSMASSRTVQQSIAGQAQWICSLAQSAGTVLQLGSTAAHVAQRGLKPIHAKACANAKRLRRG